MNNCYHFLIFVNLILNKIINFSLLSSFHYNRRQLLYILLYDVARDKYNFIIRVNFKIIIYEINSHLLGFFFQNDQSTPTCFIDSSPHAVTHAYIIQTIPISFIFVIKVKNSFVSTIRVSHTQTHKLQMYCCVLSFIIYCRYCYLCICPWFFQYTYLYFIP